MDKNLLTDLTKAIGQEIKYYSNLKDLYQQKREALIAHDLDKLLDVDVTIRQEIVKIKKLSESKANLLSGIPSEQLKLHSLIEIAEQTDASLTDVLKAQRAELEILAKEIAHLERVNQELLKLGVKYTSKMLDYIFGVKYVDSNEYNVNGKTKRSLELSSVEQNA